MNKTRFQRGEIVTILTIITFVILGISAIASSFIVGNKNLSQTTKTRAEEWQCPGGNCDKCGLNGWCGSGCSSFCTQHPGDCANAGACTGGGGGPTPTPQVAQPTAVPTSRDECPPSTVRCKDDYNEACPGSGVKSCHKEGCGAPGAAGTSCPWDARWSRCTACPTATPTNSRVPTPTSPQTPTATPSCRNDGRPCSSSLLCCHHNCTGGFCIPRAQEPTPTSPVLPTPTQSCSQINISLGLCITTTPGAPTATPKPIDSSPVPTPKTSSECKIINIQEYCENNNMWTDYTFIYKGDNIYYYINISDCLQQNKNGYNINSFCHNYDRFLSPTPAASSNLTYLIDNNIYTGGHDFCEHLSCKIQNNSCKYKRFINQTFAFCVND